MLVHPENDKWIIVSDLGDTGGQVMSGTRQRSAGQITHTYSWSDRYSDWVTSGGLSLNFDTQEQAQAFLDANRDELAEKLERKLARH